MIHNAMEVTTPIVETVVYILGLIQSALVPKNAITRYLEKDAPKFVSHPAEDAIERLKGTRHTW